MPLILPGPTGATRHDYWHPSRPCSGSPQRLRHAAPRGASDRDDTTAENGYRTRIALFEVSLFSLAIRRAADAIQDQGSILLRERGLFVIEGMRLLVAHANTVVEVRPRADTLSATAPMLVHPCCHGPRAARSMTAMEGDLRAAAAPHDDRHRR